MAAAAAVSVGVAKADAKAVAPESERAQVVRAGLSDAVGVREVVDFVIAYAHTARAFVAFGPADAYALSADRTVVTANDDVWVWSSVLLDRAFPSQPLPSQHSQSAQRAVWSVSFAVQSISPRNPFGVSIGVFATPDTALRDVTGTSLYHSSALSALSSSGCGAFGGAHFGPYRRSIGLRLNAGTIVCTPSDAESFHPPSQALSSPLYTDVVGAPIAPEHTIALSPAATADPDASKCRAGDIVTLECAVEPAAAGRFAPPKRVLLWSRTRKGVRQAIGSYRAFDCVTSLFVCVSMCGGARVAIVDADF